METGRGPDARCCGKRCGFSSGVRELQKQYSKYQYQSNIKCGLHIEESVTYEYERYCEVDVDAVFAGDD